MTKKVFGKKEYIHLNLLMLCRAVRVFPLKTKSKLLKSIRPKNSETRIHKLELLKNLFLKQAFSNNS